MFILNIVLGLAACAQVTTASWAKNLNYRSPSENHPELGLSLRRIAKRQIAGRGTYDASKLNFTHGVASGDPYPTSVILWTRVAPTSDDVNDNSTDVGTVPLYYHGPTSDQIKGSTSPICVNWKVASDSALSKVVSSGQAFTSSDVDYTVKVEAGGLTAFTPYYYQFSVCGSNLTSVVGKTKTAPNANDDVTKISVAVYSCSNYPFGFFNAYGNSVRKNSVDYAIHLGDYIYEYANGEYGWGNSIGRIPQPDRQIYTLYDYRKRIATYRTDLDLLASHQNLPWITVWDDHEVADNTYRDGSSELNNTEASFLGQGTDDHGVSVDQRKMNAVRAYFEWMPLRQVEMDDNLRIWRSFSLGKLLDLVMLDTRQYDRSITDLYWNTDYVHAISNDAGRSMMGSRQENWFYQSLIDSSNRGAAWRIVGSQTVFSKLNESAAYGSVDPLDYDAWDGYQSNRNRTLKLLYDNNIGNNIFLSGDSHASWVSDLVWLDHANYDPKTGAGSIGVEFAGSAVTSPCPYGQNITIATANNYTQWLVANNPELQWNDLYYRGYYELHISKQQVLANYYGMPTIRTRNPLEISLANFTVNAGDNKLARPVAGGTVESGTLKGGVTKGTNITHDTSNNQWIISSPNTLNPPRRRAVFEW